MNSRKHHRVYLGLPVAVFFFVAVLVVGPAQAQSTDTNSLPSLITAALKGDIANVKEVLASGAKVDEKDNIGRTALICAAGLNDRASGGFGGKAAPPPSDDALVKLLLGRHANPNAVSNDGTTPLLAALVHKTPVSGPYDLKGSQNARFAKVTALLAAGASVNVRTRSETMDHLRAGATPLIAAAINGDPREITLLLAKGADVNAKDQGGNTALIEAARLGNIVAVQTLIARHADVNARNAKGDNAISMATRLKSRTMVRCADLLRAAGAR
jgi:ankyrin repeat protein